MTAEKQERPATTAGRSNEIPQGTRVAAHRTIPESARTELDAWRAEHPDAVAYVFPRPTGAYPRWAASRVRVSCCTGDAPERRRRLDGYALASHLRLATFPEAVRLDLLDVEPCFPVFDWEVAA